MSAQIYEVLLPFLVDLYGPQEGPATFEKLQQRLDIFRSGPGKDLPVTTGSINQQDILLITYPDQITEPGKPPLAALASFGEKYLAGLIGDLHLLPFFPSSSDDGFAVIDYLKVDPAVGTWIDISRMAQRYRLMVDAVINHVSSRSTWFKGFLENDPRYRDAFITAVPGWDLTRVVRPRALPLLTSFQTVEGEKELWTTFSADQVDLNYKSPEVLLDILDVLLFYIANGAQWIRLDAVAYLWKEPGTSCIHLPQTHTIIRFFRAVLDLIAPYAMLVTETNVPHHENISYFGNGHDEAQMVYNFALPPLLMHTFLTGRADALSAWAAGLVLPSREVTYLNFLASHDGIGLNPVREILSAAEIEALVDATRKHGGLVSTKTTPDGSTSPYELNISYFDALSDPRAPEPLDLQIDRFMAAQAILLALVGVAGIYIHSLLGSRSWTEGVRQTGRNRTINRQKFEYAALEAELGDPSSLRARVFQRYTRLIAARAGVPAFDPHGAHLILPVGETVFGLLRIPPTGEKPVVCLHNVTAQAQPVRLDGKALGLEPRVWQDLLTGQTFVVDKQTLLLLRPYQVLWLV